MKKKILTILLAGLMAMSAISCGEPSVNPNENPNGTSGPTGTTGTTGTTQPPVNTDQYITANDVVYAVVNNLNLRTAPSTSASAPKQVAFATELVRVKYNSNWTVVNYDGAEYYVSTAYLTTDDIAAKKFTPHAEKEMYATEAVKVRLYPTTHAELSKAEHILKTLKANDAVTVVGTGTGWYQVKIDGKLYYVAASYLSTTKKSGVESLGDYVTQFKNGAYNQPQTMFIATDEANVRLYPSSAAFSFIVDTLQKGDRGSVVAQATINGNVWAQIQIEDPNDPAAPPAKYYISLDCLSATEGGASLDLTQLLTLYPSFKTYTEPKTMYVATTVEVSLAVRLSPSIPAAPDTYANCLDSALWPKAKTTLTVVAYGTGTNAGWSIISYANGFYFVNTVYLTPNANGTPVLTLEAVLAQYPSITQCTEKSMVILKNTNYYSVPSMAAAEKLGTFEAGKTVTVIASGMVGAYDIYVIKGEDGNCWFITADASYVGAIN